MTRTSRPCGWGFACAAGLLALCASGPGRAACNVQMRASLPVTMEGLRPKIRAKINGADATFLADSGAFYSVITPASAREFGLRQTPARAGFYIVGLGGNASVSIATVKELIIAGYTIPNVDFLVGGSEVGDDHGGIIGENFLGFEDAEYDLAGGVIRLMRPKGCGDAHFAYWAKNGAYSVMDIEPTEPPLNRKIVGAVTINGVRMRAEFDTGAPNSILWRRAAKRAGIDVAGAGVTYAGLASGMGRGHYQVWVAPVDAFKIGGEEIRHTRLVIGDTDLNVPDAPDMLLGADFFLAHRIYVANSQHKIYFTYNGGPVFDIKVAQATAPAPAATEPPPPAPDGSVKSALIDATPTDADGFARRGAALAARGDLGAAVADLTQAVDMAPGDAEYRLQRAQTYMRNRQPFLAMADLDAGLKIDPANVAGLTFRAYVRLGGHDKAGAIADLDAADRAAPREADARLGMGEMYARADTFPAAVAQFDAWIKAHPDDSKRPTALNGRCWARALWGEGLDQALEDCNQAVRGLRQSANPLDSRGLVHLRRGQFDAAVADYTAALAIRPNIPWSLYGRGVAELRKGLSAQGNIDIAAAKALDPSLPAEAKAHGVVP